MAISAGIIETCEKVQVQSGRQIEFKRICISATSDFLAESNSLVMEMDVPASGAWISPGGWQSWSPSYEIGPGQRQDSLSCSAVPQWDAYLQVPGEGMVGKDVVRSQFITVFRNGNEYFVVASTGNASVNSLPPVYYETDRKKNLMKVFVCDRNKFWKNGETIAELSVFTVADFFDAKDVLSFLYDSSRFDRLEFLGSLPGGWESWYNHYTDIDEKLIMEDLCALSATGNMVSRMYFGREKTPVFQIDDGWEIALGDWEWNKKKFPSGASEITALIERKNCIPGLWIAPFIIDFRSETARRHPDWLLRDGKGNLVPAGYNPSWGAKKGPGQPGRSGTFYCLDLSRDDVLDFLDCVMERAVNIWGFRYIKLDFLYAGMLYGAHSAGGSAYQWFSRAVKVITGRSKTRQGKPVAYLGCGCPFELCMNHFPLSRIGCDTYEHWENRLPKFLGWFGRNSAYLNLKDSIGHAMWNRSVFFCDPDVLFVRKDNCSLSAEEKRVIASVAFMFGSQMMYSDDPSKCRSAEELRLTDEFVALEEKLRGNEFSAVTVRKDVFRFENRQKTISGTIDLKKRSICFD